MAKKNKKNRLGVTEVNFIALVLALIFITVGSKVQKRDFFNGILINEFIFILLPGIVLLRKSDVKKVLKLNKLPRIDWLRVVLITILFYPIVLLANGLFLTFLSNTYELKDFSLDMLQHNRSIFVYIFYMGLVPCICEEVFFRGALLNAYEQYGNWFAIFCSAAVFAIFHFDPQNLLAPFMLGILFAVVMEASGSLYAAMIAHFTNNVLGILGAKYFNGTIFNFLKGTRLVWEVGSVQFFTIIVLILLSALSLFLIIRLYNGMRKNAIRDGSIQEMKLKYKFDIMSFWPIFVMVIVYFIYLRLNYNVKGIFL